MAMKPGAKLREALLVENLALGKSIKDSAIAAGYSPSYAEKSASAIAKRPTVVAAVAEARAKISERTTLTGETLMDKLEDALKNAIEWKQGSAVAKILELQGRIIGAFIDKLQVQTEVKVDLKAAIETGWARVAALKHTPAMIDITPKEKTETAAPADVIFGD